MPVRTSARSVSTALARSATCSLAFSALTALDLLQLVAAEPRASHTTTRFAVLNIAPEHTQAPAAALESPKSCRLPGLARPRAPEPPGCDSHSLRLLTKHSKAARPYRHGCCVAELRGAAASRRSAARPVHDVG